MQSVTAEDIRSSGEFNLSDVVNDVPSLLQSVTSEQSIDATAEFSDGANVLNLRGLGAERTLVLVPSSSLLVLADPLLVRVAPLRPPFEPLRPTDPLRTAPDR